MTVAVVVTMTLTASSRARINRLTTIITGKTVHKTDLQLRQHVRHIAAVFQGSAARWRRTSPSRSLTREVEAADVRRGQVSLNVGELAARANDNNLDTLAYFTRITTAFTASITLRRQ
jgi:hypothetical protein